ncbi:hypothetical protein KIH39_26220 [Telmatocola sphagniphila]|jgi:hypothetical protein|uniref:Uncharacterized protein n=1 Tax=Telmatocola sphagniphila TaxID=1123043 RepID=A0A8E6B6X9_9BACT|nr:hypothetical protein [Telmatocola sphagniphila]QVL32286.1 hypothetical protein KIH39_26220 [Telmatocola sphagniphila]
MRAIALLFITGLMASAVRAGDPPVPVIVQPGQTIIISGGSAAPVTNVVTPSTKVVTSAASAASCSTCDKDGKKSFYAKIKTRLGACPNGSCDDKGCANPLGCGNLWTDGKFLFGSCRDFFGTDVAATGHLHKTNVP